MRNLLWLVRGHRVSFDRDLPAATPSYENTKALEAATLLQHSDQLQSSCRQLCLKTAEVCALKWSYDMGICFYSAMHLMYSPRTLEAASIIDGRGGLQRGRRQAVWKQRLDDGAEPVVAQSQAPGLRGPKASLCSTGQRR